MISTYLLSLLYSLSQFSSEPGTEYAYIVQLMSGQELEFHAVLSEAYDEVRLEVIYKDLDYYRLRFRNPVRSPATSVLEASVVNGLISWWKPDLDVTARGVPNDVFWSDQWDMERIGMPQAWDISTGGLTTDGDTIVIAILDDGYDVLHRDLGSAFWRNRGEIPGDLVDNDFNGYVDDYLGLNLQTGTDDHTAHTHGTAVAGIIGAIGNNGEGISGINWSVRIMPISGIDKESDVVEGFGYIKEMRELYNASNGTEGAFIVASNLSAGIDNAWAIDHPAWCAVYDDLGSVGVLNIAATTNKNEDVDVNGDMPSTCTSNYLVMVTNTDIDDQKLLFAGYGSQHVDIGAPGSFSKTTDINDAYLNFESTSAATPHVTGAVGLLYSAPCPDFMQSVKSDPAQAALQVKAILLQSADSNVSLAGITTSGGRLNVFEAIQNINAFCGGSTGDLAILAVYPNPVRGPLMVKYQTMDLSSHIFRLFDAAGREIVSEVILPPPTGLKQYTLDTTHLPGGVYFLSLTKGNQRATIRILVP